MPYDPKKRQFTPAGMALGREQLNGFQVLVPAGPASTAARIWPGQAMALTLDESTGLQSGQQDCVIGLDIPLTADPYAAVGLGGPDQAGLIIAGVTRWLTIVATDAGVNTQNIADSAAAVAAGDLAAVVTNGGTPVFANLPDGFRHWRHIGLIKIDAAATGVDAFITQDSGRTKFYMWENDITLRKVLVDGAAVVWTTQTSNPWSGDQPALDSPEVLFSGTLTTGGAGGKVSFRPHGSTVVNGTYETEGSNNESEFSLRIRCGVTGLVQYMNSAAAFKVDLWVSGFWVTF